MVLPRSHKRYQVWGEFLKRERSKRFRSAREFCTHLPVGISYPQYSRYEAGEQLPALEHAIELCRLLGVPLLEGLLEWNRAQIQNESVLSEVNSLLASLREPTTAASQAPAAPAPASVTTGISLDDIIVFNRSHLKLFSSDPAYRDLFTYVNSFSPEWITVDELMQAMRLPEGKIADMLQNLSDLGVITVKEGKCSVSKRNFYFPDDGEFFPLRNQNLIHNSTEILKDLTHEKLLRRQAYRGLLTRELTAEQLDQVISKVDNLLNEVVNMSESARPEKIYSICLLLGERFSRATAKGKAGLPPGLPGLKTEGRKALDPAADSRDFN